MFLSFSFFTGFVKIANIGDLIEPYIASCLKRIKRIKENDTPQTSL